MNTDYLKEWNVKKEQQKVDFMERLYQYSGRTNGLFTGLWRDFCVEEAGPICRDDYFAQLEAIEKFKQMEYQQKLQPKQAMISKEEFIPTLHD